MKITVTVCDVCQDKDAPTRAYEIRSEGRKARVELCAPHGQTFEAYLTQTAPPPDPGRQRQPRKRASRAAAANGGAKKVYTIAEIEALKQSK